MRTTQTRDEKIVAAILQKLLNEQINIDITDSPDICFENIWAEVLNITPEVLHTVSSLHNKAVENKDLKKITKSTITRESEEFLYNQVITKLKNDYDVEDWITEIEKNVVSKIEKYEKYCENTEINNGILCLYLQFHGTMYWAPENSTPFKGVYDGMPFNIEAMETKIEEAKLTIDGTNVTMQSDMNSELLKINNLKDFKNILSKTGVFNKYKKVIVIDHVRSSGAISKYNVSIYNNVHNFNVLNFSLGLLSVNICGNYKGKYENYRDGKFHIRPICAIEGNFKNKVFEITPKMV